MLTALALVLVAATPARAAFGFQSLSSSFAVPGGGASTVLLAGSHPESWTMAVSLATVGGPGEEHPDGALDDLRIDLPPGLVAAPALRPQCSRSDFVADDCPAATSVGQITVESAKSAPIEAPLYLLAPLPGRVAQLGLHAFGIPMAVEISISPDPPYNLIAEIRDISQAVEVLGATLTVDGNGTPFFTLPRSCSSPLVTGFSATSWGVPGLSVSTTAPEPQLIAGCGSLSYEPELSATPTTAATAAPSGLDVDLDAPDPSFGAAKGYAAADAASARLVLPSGMTVNPAAAAGLRTCSPAELASERPDSDAGTGCPGEAKVGSATVTTPLLAEPIGGSIYAAQPDDPSTVEPGAENPFDSFLALYLVFRDAERGVLLELPIRIDADSSSGRLTGHLDQIPELPLSHLALRFNSGPRAPLATPPGCGAHRIGYSLTPSSGRDALGGEQEFVLASGCGVGFEPDLSAGMGSYAAGAASPFVLELRNAAGAPNLSGLRLTLPPGIAANLTAAATCPEPAAGSASCPSASRLGFVRIALGAGSDPLWVPAGSPADSDVYLAGPYQGAPFSLLVAVPAAAGPFDLGRIVLRAPVRIDPRTAQVSVQLTGLPQILDGIPLHYRSLRLVLDRPGFVRNPTSCEAGSIELTASAADGATASVSDPYQAADCDALGFRPRLAVRLSGGLGRNGHPRLELSLAPRPGEANLAAASFDLPAGELLDTRRIRALCDRQLPLERCPAESRVGSAVVESPLLPQPLSGPVFLRSPSARYPGIVAELSAGALEVRVRGRVGSAPGGRLRVRIEGLPDIFLSRASIALAGGRRGIVVNSASLCGTVRHAGARLRGQSGKELSLRPRVRFAGRC